MQKINKICLELILFFSSFCYLKFFNLGTKSDLQIYYFIVSFIVLIVSSLIKINKNMIKVLLCLAIISLWNLRIDYINSLSFFRGIFGYLSFTVVFFAIYKILNKKNLNLVERRIKIYFWIWNIVALFQIIDKSLFIFWRYRASMGQGRGAVSFATEPAYFSFFLILSSLILYSIDKKNKKYLIYSFISCSVLARSFIGIVYLSIIIFICYLNKKNLFKILGTAILILLLEYIIIQYLPENSPYRVVRLLKQFLKEPFLIFLKDKSIRERIIHIIFSLKGSCENFFMPKGFSTWVKYSSINRIIYKDFFSFDIREIEKYTLYVFDKKNIINNNINTMLGGIFYELGFLGFIFYHKIYKICLNKKVWIIILILSLDGLNITNPYLAILLAINYFLYKNRKINIL